MDVSQRRWFVAAAGLAVAAALAGCAPATVPALERRATPADTLPAGVTGFNGFDPASARHVASRDGVEFYLAKQTGEVRDGVCLVATKATVPAEWASACGDGPWFGLNWAHGNVNAEFHRNGVTDTDVKPGWSQLSENVTVED